MRFRDLGPLRIEVEDRSVTLGGRLASVMETLLLHRGQRVALDLLLDAVWPDGVTARSASTLETHVWRLRKLLEPERERAQARVLINDRGGYRLVTAPSQVDSAQFEQAAVDVLDLLTTKQYGRALAASDRALELWRGDPYELVTERLWATGPIAGLVETRALLRERRIDALLGVGRAEVAVVDLEPMLVEHPFRERLWWQRMLALHRLGRTDEALRTYRTIRRRLLDEIGLEPGPELVELEGRILNQDPMLLPDAADEPAVTAVVRSVELRLPRRRDLVGRAAELAAVGSVLGPGRLVSIVGAAGCGKTVLAVEAGRLSAAHFPDGVTLVDLTAIDPGGDPALAVATALEISVPEGVGTLEAIIAYGSGRRELLLLDNCEQVLDAVADLVEPLAESCPQLGLLITSREPLDLSSEHVHQLAPLVVPAQRRGDTPMTADETALTLFVSRARIDDDPAGGDLAHARRICRAVDGIPLALELAAALTTTYTLAEVAEQVERDPGQLAAVGRGQARHHQTLAAAIDRSHRLLGEQEQALYRRLAVVPGSFGRDVAEAVVEPAHRHLVAGQLASLAHRSLLTTDRAQGRTRFAQLAPIRAHALHGLRASGELARAEQLCDDWICTVVREKPRAGRPEEAAWHTTVQQDLPTLRAALQRGVDDHSAAEHGSIGSVVGRLLGFWFYTDQLEEGTRWTEAALPRTVEASLPGVLVRLTLAGMLAMRSRADRARQLLIRAIDWIDVEGGGGLAIRGASEAVSELDQVLLAELLLGTTTSFSFLQDPDAMRMPLELLERTAWLDRDVDLALVRDAARCLVEVVSGEVADALRLVESTYARAVDHGNVWAAWIAASCGSTIALGRRDPKLGLGWSRRVIVGQASLGARVVLPQLETFGDFLALDGRWVEAVRIFSATHYRARRTGNPWPRNPPSTGLLARCRAALSEIEFNAAWAGGPTLSRDELLGGART